MLLPEQGGDGSVGTVFNGIGSDDNTGVGLSDTRGDVNGDGVEDLLIGAPGESFYHTPGLAYVVFGGAAAPDADADGVPDQQDNCTVIANADQRDTDDDGFGNLCDADLDNSCAINFQDLGLMKSAFFRSGDVDADLNGDLVVNFGDLALLKQAFFGEPGPSGVPKICSAPDRGLRPLPPQNRGWKPLSQKDRSETALPHRDAAPTLPTGDTPSGTSGR
jgi:hypothetical protein